MTATIPVLGVALAAVMGIGLGFAIDPMIQHYCEWRKCSTPESALRRCQSDQGQIGLRGARRDNTRALLESGTLCFVVGIACTLPGVLVWRVTGFIATALGAAMILVAETRKHSLRCRHHHKGP